ncbi:MAG: hypothetical protein HRT61_14005, partial [Ekhidna sp.]|nr:hypothetical protein [Ekhidna sp.]
VHDERKLENLSNEDLAPLLSADDGIWTILTPTEKSILDVINEKGQTLEKHWDVKINFGVKTGYNDAFIIDQKKRDELVKADPKNEEIIKPVVRGREIERYLLVSENLHIVFIPWHFPLQLEEIKGASPEAEKKLRTDYPSLYEHLLSHKTNLSKRNKAETGIRYEWYALQRCAATYFEEFELPKVVWKRIGSIMRFSYSEDKEICLDSTCIATGEKIKYLTTLMNSKLMLYFLHKTSPKTGTGDCIISVQALEPLPVYYPNEQEEQFFVSLFEIIMALKTAKTPLSDQIKNAQLSKFFEDVVDGCVFDLYFEEHMKSLGIDITDIVKSNILEVFGTTNLEGEELKTRTDSILKLYDQLKDGEVQKRMRQFVSKSPDILKPVIQQK